MAAFLHDRVQRFTGLLEAVNDAMRAYNELAPTLNRDVEAALDAVVATYHQLSLAAGENEVLAARSQFTSAQRGLNPVTLERVTSRRREVERTVALHTLSLTGERLRADLSADETTLSNIREQLVPITLHALRKGLIAERNGVPPAQNELERSWKAVLDDDELQMSARQVAMHVATVDVLLILADLIDAIRPTPL